MTIIREFHLYLTKVISMLKHSVKIRRYINTVCPTRYRIRHFFNNYNTSEDIAMKFEQEYVRCVRNEEECVCSPLQISLQYPH